MILSLLVVPVVAAVLAFLPAAAPLRRALLVLAAALHGGLSLATWVTPATPEWHGMLALDAVAVTSVDVASGGEAAAVASGGRGSSPTSTKYASITTAIASASARQSLLEKCRSSTRSPELRVNWSHAPMVSDPA